MSTGNTGSCILSILWKPYRVRRRKERRKEHRGGLPGALMRMESGHGAEFGNWKQQNLRFWDGSAIPFCFSSANLFYSWELFFIMKNAPRGSQSLSRRSEGTASVWKMPPVRPPQAENPGPLPRLLRRAGGAAASGGGLWASVRNILLFHSIHKEIVKKT